MILWHIKIFFFSLVVTCLHKCQTRLKVIGTWFPTSSGDSSVSPILPSFMLPWCISVSSMLPTIVTSAFSTLVNNCTYFFVISGKPRINAIPSVSQTIGLTIPLCSVWPLTAKNEMTCYSSMWEKVRRTSFTMIDVPAALNSPSLKRSGLPPRFTSRRLHPVLAPSFCPQEGLFLDRILPTGQTPFRCQPLSARICAQNLPRLADTCRLSARPAKLVWG